MYLLGFSLFSIISLLCLAVFDCILNNLACRFKRNDHSREYYLETHRLYCNTSVQGRVCPRVPACTREIPTPATYMIHHHRTLSAPHWLFSLVLHPSYLVCFMLRLRLLLLHVLVCTPLCNLQHFYCIHLWCRVTGAPSKCLRHCRKFIQLAVILSLQCS